MTSYNNGKILGPINTCVALIKNYNVIGGVVLENVKSAGLFSSIC